MVSRIIILTIAILFLFTIFTSTNSFGEPEADEASQQVILWAGRNIEVGTVTVSNDLENIYVKYETIAGWYLTETHLAIATELEDIPQTKKGNPKVGHFPYQEVHNPPVAEYTYEIELEPDYTHGTEILITAHSVVAKMNKAGKTIKEETAWGGELRFPGNNWATYFNYELILPNKLNLPSDSANMIVEYPGPGSYFNTIISEIPNNFDISNGEFTGWCADTTVFIYPNTDYEIMVYSSYDPNVPDHVNDDEHWDMINYILNHKHPEAEPDDIQQALWYFTDDGNTMPTDPEAQAMVEDALANGSGFFPGPGDVMAVICDAGESVQLIFIEIEL